MLNSSVLAGKYLQINIFKLLLIEHEPAATIVIAHVPYHNCLNSIITTESYRNLSLDKLVFAVAKFFQ